MRNTEYKKFMKNLKEERWSDVIQRYYKWAKLAHDYNYNPNSYAAKFREDYWDDYRDFPLALKAFEEIDREIIKNA